MVVVLAAVGGPVAMASGTTFNLANCTANQSYVVPSNTVEVTIAAGGQGGDAGRTPTGNAHGAGVGGNPGFVTATVPVTAGETLYVASASGGSGGEGELPDYSAGNGGHATYVTRDANAACGRFSESAPLVVAAGGGGGGAGGGFAPGGTGGSSNGGQNGGDGNGGGGNGRDGSGQTAGAGGFGATTGPGPGGAAGHSGCGNAPPFATAGASGAGMLGGDGGLECFTRYISGGGGGSGYYGGGGGGGDADDGGGGGGGGSNFAVSDAVDVSYPSSGTQLSVTITPLVPITDTAALTSDHASPVADGTFVNLTLTVTTSTGVLAQGFATLVDYSHANGAGDPAAPGNCPCQNVGQDYVSGGEVTFRVNVRSLRFGLRHDLVASFQSSNRRIPDAKASGLDLTITPTQVITFTSTAPTDAVATGPTYGVTAMDSDGHGDSLPVNFSIDSASSSICSISGTTVSFLAAGTCKINATDSTGAHAEQSFTVAPPKAQTIAFTSTAPTSAMYGGSYSPMGTGGGSGNQVTFSSATTSVCTASGGTVSFVGVGTCTINADQAAGPGYAAAGTMTQSFTVAHATLTITASSGSMVYGGSPPAITPNYDGFVNGDNSSSLTTAPMCSTTATSASSVAGSPYGSGCSDAVDSNYTINYAPGFVGVTQASLTVTASSASMVYGGSPPTITPSYGGFVNGDRPSSLTTAPTCTTTATSSSAVAGSPYGSSCSGAADANYMIGYTPGSVAVTRARLSVTADPKTKTYGQPNPAFTVSYAGFLNGDGDASLGGALSFATAATSTSPVGSYDVTPSGVTSNNYSITFTAGSLTIGPAASATTVASSLNPSEFGQSVTLTATVAPLPAGAGSATGTVTFKDGMVPLGTVTVSGGKTTLTTSSLAVASHSLTATYSGDTNVNGSTSATVAQVVNKARTTLVATPAGRLQSRFTATLTRTFDGLALSGETVTFSVSGYAICSATTNAQGQSTCAPLIGLFLGPASYTATFTGDPNYQASTGTGKFSGLFGVGLLRWFAAPR